MIFARIDNRVYVARSKTSGAFKVGLSSNVEQRLKVLGRQHGALELVCAFRAPRFWTDALRLERKAHRLLSRWCVGGEWFSADCAHVIGSWLVAGRVAR